MLFDPATYIIGWLKNDNWRVNLATGKWTVEDLLAQLQELSEISDVYHPTRGEWKLIRRELERHAH